MAKNNNTKFVYMISEYDFHGSRRTEWIRIGVAFVNKDNSLNVFLKAIPGTGKLHIRDAKRLTKEEMNNPESVTLPLD